MGDHALHNQLRNSTSVPNVPRQPHIPWEQQRQIFLERMSLHKYNPRQMLFVKNVPQESAIRIAGLYTQYKPLETKNLYPGSRITTFMIALPNIGATEEALRQTDGQKVGNTVVTVERYNPKQSIVARRDARKKRSNLPNGHANYTYDEEDYDEYDGDDGDEEVRAKDTPRLAKLVAKQPEADVAAIPMRTRRVGESGGISWANIAGGTQPEQRPLSTAPPAKADTPQQDLGDIESFPAFDHHVQPENIPDLHPSPANGARANTGLPPPGLSAPAVILPLRQSSTRIAVTPTTTSPVSYDHLYTASERSLPPQATQTQTSDSSRIAEDSSQQSYSHNVELIQRGMLAMPSDTTAFMRRRHCAGCAFCWMRIQSKARADHQMNDGY